MCAVAMAMTAQTEPIDDRQVQNNAGGFVYKLSDMQRLRRFLVLGSEGGTYYATEQKLGLDNAKCIQRLIDAGQGPDAVAEIVRFSLENRAPKQDPMLFGLALCARSSNESTQKAAYEAVTKVCRIPTHLFSFMEYCQLLSKPGGRGQGRAHRRAISLFYNMKKASQMSFLCTKYASRGGWTHRDVLRLSHVTPATDAHNMVFHYIIKGFDSMCKLPCVTAVAASADGEKVESIAAVADNDDDDDDDGDNSRSASTAAGAAQASTEEASAATSAAEISRTLAFLKAVEAAKQAKTAEAIVPLIQQFRLAREHVPTQLLNSVAVWEAMLPHMPLTALIRNLGKMSAIELLAPGNAHTATVVAKLADAEELRRSRVHPFAVLVALRTYQQGHGDKGSLQWQVVPELVTALDAAFYAAFGNVQASNKRHLLALDVSGSMTGGSVCGTSVLTPRVASAAMAMVTARTEPQSLFMAFSDSFVPLDIRADDSLELVMEKMGGLPFSSTDCSLPMQWALENQQAIDVFVVYTDNETYAGRMHPSQALQQYREATGIDAKLIVVGMTATEFTIADPDDTGMMDVVGFDAGAPEVMSNFAQGLI